MIYKTFILGALFFIVPGLFARFVSIDPERQYNNLYSYGHNNSINLVDSDGRNFTYTSETRNGKRYINLHLSASMINESAKNITETEMRQYAKTIEENFTKIVVGTERDYVFTASIDIQVIKKQEDMRKGDHIIRIRNPSDLPNPNSLGRGTKNQNVVYLSSALLDPNNKINKWQSDGYVKTDLGYTSVHEILHSAGLDHFYEHPNIMAETAHSQASKAIGFEQIWALLENRLNVNQGDLYDPDDPKKPENEKK